MTWIKNRSVTLGCTATTYCPNEDVSRLQMAAFMNRAGNVLTPSVLNREEAGTTLDFSSDHVVCQTPDLPALPRDYPRTIDTDAALSVEVSGLQSLIVVPVFARNGGTWQSLGQGSFPVLAPGARHNVTALTAAFLHFEATNPGSTLKFGIRVSRQNQFGPTITSWTCHLQVMVRNAVYALEF